jgi:ribosomal protein S12 methylthiotransferase
VLKVSVVSLGCPKNQVDAEMLVAKIRASGMETVTDLEMADAVVVNTCGFIEDAKKESIAHILEAARLKKKSLKALVVTGCLAQRYKSEILAEIDEVNAVVGLSRNADIAEIIRQTVGGERMATFDGGGLCQQGERVLSTPFYTAYLRIADGCDNRCSYCAIPQIRGRYQSRPVEDILEEAQSLAAGGVKELCVIAQDTTRYGQDLYKKLMLPELLEGLCEIKGIDWIRILYAYPDSVTDKLLSVMARQKKILPYLDLPVQHANGEILKAMNRRGDVKELTALIGKIRGSVPGICLRTTLIVGFPGEKEEHFAELLDFVEQTEFDRLGCFTYSPEEGTPAAGFKWQISEKMKASRQNKVMECQRRITARKNRQKIGGIYDILTEGFDAPQALYRGRSAADAPEIDGRVYFGSPDLCEPGKFARVKILDSNDYDLFGERIM